MKTRAILCICSGLAAIWLSSCTYSDYQEYYTYPYPDYRTPPLTYRYRYSPYRYYPYDYRKAPPSGGSPMAPDTGYSSHGGAESFEAIQRPSTYSYQD